MIEQTMADVPVVDAERAAQNAGWLDLTNTHRSMLLCVVKGGVAGFRAGQ